MSTNQTPQERSIYGGYRATLKGIHRGAKTRAGARKQEALRITAERYKVPISTVKAIVREQEAQDGIVTSPRPISWSAGASTGSTKRSSPGCSLPILSAAAPTAVVEPMTRSSFVLAEPWNAAPQGFGSIPVTTG